MSRSNHCLQIQVLVAEEGKCSEKQVLASHTCQQKEGEIVNPFSVLFVSFIGGFTGSLFAMQVAQVQINRRLIQEATMQIAPYIDDIELQ